MKKGAVKFFYPTNGFGFIRPSGSGDDFFVHESGLTEEVRENDEVEYEEERGMNAVNVKVVSSMS